MNLTQNTVLKKCTGSTQLSILSTWFLLFRKSHNLLCDTPYQHQLTHKHSKHSGITESLRLEETSKIKFNL